jgi:hypothetical protein
MAFRLTVETPKGGWCNDCAIVALAAGEGTAAWELAHTYSGCENGVGRISVTQDDERTLSVYRSAHLENREGDQIVHSSAGGRQWIRLQDKLRCLGSDCPSPIDLENVTYWRGIFTLDT